MAADTYSQITIKGETYRNLVHLKVNDPRFAECRTISAVIVKLIEMNGGSE
jgi:predicted CopG family antitoxin